MTFYNVHPSRCCLAHPGAGARARDRGFNLIEVMLALAIFTIGFVTVGALLPVAISEQRWAMDDAMAQQLARAAQDTLRGKKLHLHNSGPFPGLLDLFPHNAAKLQLLPDTFLGAYYDPADRSSPNYAFVGNGSRGLVDLNNRRFYWTALARNLVTSTDIPAAWQVCVMVMRRESNDVPQPVPVATAVSVSGNRFNFTNSAVTAGGQAVRAVTAGDLVVDDLGGVYRAVNADSNGITVAGTVQPQAMGFVGLNLIPGHIWYCPPQVANKPSPTMNILVLYDVVEP